MVIFVTGMCTLGLLGYGTCLLVYYGYYYCKKIYENEYKCYRMCCAFSFIVCIGSVIIIGCLTMISFGIAFAVTLGFIFWEILNFILIAGMGYIIFEENIPTYTERDYYFWSNIEKWILKYKNHKDRLLRIIIVNKLCSDGNSTIVTSNKLIQHINSSITERNTKDCKPFSNITFKSMRDAVNYGREDRKPANMFYYFYLDELWGEMMEVKDDMYRHYDSARNNNNGTMYFEAFIDLLLLMSSFTVVFILMPIYMLSRIFKILYPFIIVIYLTINNTWYDTDMFQLFMLAFYLIIEITIILLSYHVFIAYHTRYYIDLPKRYRKGISTVKDAYKLLNNINKYYINIINIPQRTKILITIFGNDIGNIIDSYLPWF